MIEKITSVKIDGSGEVIDNKVKILKKYSPFKDDKGYNFKYKSTKIKSYLEIDFPKTLSVSDIGRLYLLSRKIYSNTNLLGYRLNKKIKPYAKKYLMNYLSINKSTFYEFWGKIEGLNVIKKITIDNTEYYCINPLYFNSTNYLPLYLYIAFQDELVEHLPEWVIDRYLSMIENQ